MSEPLVSIITPTYNHEAFIGACLESVLAQSYPNWELIVIDDGSSDRTWEIIQRYAERDRRIRPLRQGHRGAWGLVDTYNDALAQSTGDLIAIVEGDDYWPPDKLATQVPHHTSDPQLLLSYGQVMIVRDGQETGLYHQHGVLGTHPSTTYLRLALLRSSALMSISIVVRRSALEAIGGFRQDGGYPAVDLPTWLRVVREPGNVAYLDRILGYWRHYGTQVTHRLGVEMAEASRDIVLRQFRELPPDQAEALGLTEQDVIMASRPNLADAYFGRLRAALQDRDRSIARQCVPALWRYGGKKRKLQAVYGVLAQQLDWDMERILAACERWAR